MLFVGIHCKLISYCSCILHKAKNHIDMFVLGHTYLHTFCHSIWGYALGLTDKTIASLKT